MNRPTALVTGGAGYIGSHVVRALLSQGFELTVIDNLSTGLRTSVPAGVRFVRGDVGDMSQMQDLLDEVRPGVILHFAGSTSAAGSVADPLHYYENNTGKSRRLIEAAIACASRPAILFSSSAAVYGAPETTRVSETAPTRPLNPYGMSKLMTEQMLKDAASAHGLRFVALRYFNVAGCTTGAGARAGAPGSLLSVALEALSGARDHVPVYGSDYPTSDGTGVRDYIHVADLAAAHIAALPLLEREDGPRILNCGYGHGTSVMDVLRAVEQASGRALNIRYFARRPGDPSEVVADNALMLRQTDWRPQYDDVNLLVRQAVVASTALSA